MKIKEKILLSKKNRKIVYLKRCTKLKIQHLGFLLGAYFKNRKNKLQELKKYELYNWKK